MAKGRRRTPRYTPPRQPVMVPWMGECVDGAFRPQRTFPVAETEDAPRGLILADGRRDRDGDIIDTAGMSVASDQIRDIILGEFNVPATYTNEYGSTNYASLLATMRQWEETSRRIDRARYETFLHGASVGYMRVETTPSEHPELVSLLAHLDSIPALEFVRWRDEALIVADWLEERGDERGPKLRDSVANAPIGDGFFIRLVRIGGITVDECRRVTDHWKEAVAWAMEDIRFLVLERARLTNGRREPPKASRRQSLTHISR